MEHTSGRHSLIFSWWHTHTWSRRSRHSNTPQESSASNFTRSHDRAVHPAEAPFYLGFRESTVAPKCCGLFMYQFASLGLAVNWCGIVPASWYYYSVTLGSLSLSLAHLITVCLYAWFQVILHEVFHLLLFMFGWFHLSVPGKQDLQSGHCVHVWSCDWGYQSSECRYHQACIHGDCWHGLAAPASESCYWQPR